MSKLWIFLFCCALSPTPHAALEHPALCQTTLSVLHRTFQQPDPGFSDTVLKQIAQQTGLTDNEIRTQLLALVDQLEEHKKHKTATWQAILSAGGEKAKPKSVEKFLTRLLKEARKLLTKQGGYDLGFIVQKTARKAKLPMKGHALLVRVFDLSVGKPTLRSEEEIIKGLIADMPDTIGLLVEVRELPEYAEYLKNNMSQLNEIKELATKGIATVPAFRFFHTYDAEAIINRLRGIDRKLLPLVLQELPKTARVKWAIDQSTPQLNSDYLLSVEISRLFIGFLGRGAETAFRPCVVGWIELRHIDSEAVLFKQLLGIDGRSETQFCSAKYSSRNTDTLDGFFEEVAQQSQLILDEFLSGN